MSFPTNDKKINWLNSALKNVFRNSSSQEYLKCVTEGYVSLYCKKIFPRSDGDNFSESVTREGVFQLNIPYYISHFGKNRCDDYNLHFKWKAQYIELPRIEL
ncbi:hypothetical protein KW787_01700 [Candidatus Pacearchaeota archaeon]|nr:hypothetical protein [Candidatus Pacearchaeota archaeon]